MLLLLLLLLPYRTISLRCEQLHRGERRRNAAAPVVAEDNDGDADTPAAAVDADAGDAAVDATHARYAAAKLKEEERKKWREKLMMRWIMR